MTAGDGGKQRKGGRTRKDNKLPLEASHYYPEPGEYRIVVKVVGILDNDTTKMFKVKVK